MTRTTSNKKCPICENLLISTKYGILNCSNHIVMYVKDKDSIDAPHYVKYPGSTIYRFANLQVSVSVSDSYSEFYTIIDLLDANDDCIIIPHEIKFVNEKQFLDKIKLCILLS